MRAAFCLTIILLSATVGHAGKQQPSGTPAQVTFTPADARRVSAYTPRPQYPSIHRRIRGSGDGDSNPTYCAHMPILTIDQTQSSFEFL